VPDVVGLTEAAATSAIIAVDNLVVGTVTNQHSDTVAVGDVISQTPIGGTTVAIGTSVDLVVSLGQPQVPDVVSLTQAAATAAITAVDNLVVGTVTNQHSDTVAAGDVISQTPIAGTTVAVGSAVDLVVSLGQPTVPDVVSLTQAAATTAITGVDNLIVGTVTNQDSDTVPAGSVISQSPIAGTIVAVGSSVDLVVSSGQPTVPDVVGQTEAAATSAITAVDNLVVGTLTNEYSDTIPSGSVISQNPIGGTSVLIGSSVDLVVSLGQPQVPDVVSLSEAAATSAIIAVDNLVVGTVTNQHSDTVPVGDVISQSPIAGTTVAVGSAVDIVVSLGQPQVPDVVNLAQAAATSAITAVDNLLVGTVTIQDSDTVPAGSVISQSPIAGTIVAVGSSVDLVVSSGQPVVPDVVGLTEAAATSTITAVDNLVVGTVTNEYSDTVPSGSVISQNPIGGTSVPIGSSVDLVVSLGQPQVPGVVNLSEAAATSAIIAVDNLVVGTVTNQHSDTVPVGDVISQSPIAATTVAVGSAVDLVVSLGQPQVPDVVNLTQAAATSAITAVDNLLVGTVTIQDSDTVPSGSVISQSPIAGTIVAVGSTIDLVVSSGQPLVPDVVGLTEAAATSTITAVDNLVVGTVTNQYSDTVAVGDVISQSPVAGTAVAIGSSVDLVISRGKPLVPYVVDQTEAAATSAITAVDNLIAGTVTNQYSDTIVAGNVISQDPVGGTAVLVGSAVDLVVSLGQPQVPNVTGQTQGDANTAIAAVSLVTGTITYDYSDVVAAGTVISQSPIAGTTVAVGSAVDIVVSLGQPEVPDVVGLTEAAATSAIIAIDNLAVGTVTNEYSDTVAAGDVISQSPIAGTIVPIGSTVDLVVSLGQPQVPNVVGLTEADATTAITTVDNLAVGTVTNEYSDTVAGGDVISQSPIAGTIIPIGSSVDLVVSLGQPQVPDVVGLTEAAATSAITVVDNLAVGTVTNEYSDTVAAGDVISQSPIAGTIVAIGTAVDLVVSLGQPTVPDVNGLTQADASLAITAVDNLIVGTVTNQYSDTVPAGNVISQNPVAGTAVNIGTAVDLVLSLGQPQVPDVVGQAETDANLAITGVSLVVGIVSYEFSDIVAADNVISQSPIAGTTLSIGSSVDLIVSLGQPQVPDVNGMTEAAAGLAIIAVDNLIVGNITNQYSDTVAQGLLISSNPAADTVVPIGTAVDFVVSLGPEVSVPIVTGQTEAAAISAITAENLIVGIISYEYSDVVPLGSVISQNPIAGTIVPGGTTVDLVVSAGQAIVPGVIGYTQAAAYSNIIAAGLVVGAVTYEYSDTITAGLVLAQSPTGGTSTTLGSAVDIVISLGQPVVPNVVGRTEATAVSMITQIDNLVIGTITYEYNVIVPAGEVISQSPVGLTIVATGTAVDLVVSLGPSAIVPDVISLTEAAASTAITTATLIVGTVTYEHSDTVANGLVISQSPVGGTTVTAGSAVDFVVSLGQPQIPDVIGLTEAAATSAITAIDNLTVNITTSQYSDTVPAGSVISQSPIAGTTVPIGTTVNIILSLGQPIVPDVTGQTQANATIAITSVDSLVVGTVTNQYSDTVLAGRVISQSPAAGSAVPVGSAIDLVVSLGQPEVPDVTGQTEAAATSAIIAVDNLTVGTVTNQYSDTVPAGDVISQTPPGGTTVAIGSTVDFVVSLGQPQVPNIVGLVQVDANSAIALVSLAVGSITYEYNDTVALGLVISQSPTAGTSVSVGSAVNFVVSLGQPQVPDVVGMTEADAFLAVSNTDGLTIGNVTYEFSDTVATGLVISQDPIAGTAVSTGSTVDLVISLGQPEIPDVVGMTEAAAGSAITAVDNLTVGNVTYEYSDTVAAGIVISQDPVGGTTVVTSSTVDLVVSLGLPTVPDVTGQNETDANSAITAVSLVVGIVSYEYSDTVASGLVINQSPSAGTTLNVGSSIDLIVSMGQPQVPDVVGLTETDANLNITATDNLTVGTIDYEYSDTVAAGLVISQSPIAGTIVPTGSIIDLVVSMGQPQVPDVVGQTEAAATAAITAIDNLIVDAVTYEYSDTVAAGDVISQIPIGGTTVAVGSAVDLVVSSGQPQVPDVVGLTEAAATSAITAVDNLAVGNITYDYNDTVAQGLVLSQNPIAGAIVPTGTTVDIVISLGPQILVPNVVGQTQADANSAIIAENLIVGTITYEHSDVVPLGSVISQNPVSGTIVPGGTAVDMVVSAGQAIVPDVIGQSQATANSNIAAAGLVVGTVTYEYSDTYSAGLVSSQSPDAGTPVSLSSAVDIVISLGQPEVLDVTGLSEAAAVTTITEIDNLLIGTISYEFNGTVPIGDVISQNPVGGTTVATGTAVDLVVSLGVSAVVPDVISLTEAAASSAITTASLIVGNVTYEHSDTVAVGLVSSQNPTGGTTVAVDSSVDIVVSLGQPEVPDVVSLTQAAATAAITAVDNLLVGTVTTQYSNTVPPGLVISQNPIAGTTVNVGATVDIVVSLGSTAVVPDIVGQTEVVAGSAVTDANLAVGNVTYEFSVTIPAGQVISQNPIGGTTVPEGTSVDMVVSLGQSATVPDVTGQTQAAADSAITSAGFVTVVLYEYSDTVAAGLVIHQDPAGGGIVAAGSDVTIYVSSGPPIVPDVVGLTEAAAQATIEADGGLTVATTYQYDNSVAAGIVISQNPAAGTYVSIGSVVNIVVSFGRPIVPGVIGLDETSAIAAIEAVDGLSAIVTYQHHNTIPSGLVVSQSPDGGTEVDAGSTITIVVSLGRPIVPDVVGQNESAAIIAIEAVDDLVVLQSYRYFNNVPLHDVVSQDPVAGSGVDVGTTVNIMVSLGRPVVPDVVGLTESASVIAIEAVDNLTAGTITYDYSDTVTTGDVISQNPSDGTTVLIGSSIDFVVSLGQPTVPDVVGLTEAIANSDITAVSLVPGIIIYEYSDTVLSGVVISQAITAGTIVPIATGIDFVVSLGQPVVPDLTGLTQPDANQAITDVSLAIGSLTYEYSDTIPIGSVISQSPAPDTTVFVGSLVDLVISGVAVPDVVGLSEANADANIAAVGLVLGTVTYQYSEIVAPGDVISQDPNAGTMAAPAWPIDLVVSGVLVPNVVDQIQADANSTLNLAGLYSGNVTFAYHDTVITGRVISQSPTGGITVAPASSVDYVISLGQPTVPNVVGQTETDANTALAALTLMIGLFNYEYSDTVPADLIISQSPLAGTTVNTGSRVDLIISLGQPIVPDIVGLNINDATVIITNIDNLNIGTITQQYSDTIPAGVVISQNPIGGTMVPTGSTIDVLVSLGPPVTVPDVTDLVQGQANTIIYALNLVVGTVDYIHHNTIAYGNVISQDPVAGTIVPEGTAINLVGSFGWPYVPGVVGLTEAQATAAIIADGYFIVGTISYVHSDTVTAGLVISQNPVLNDFAPIGSTIEFVVSLGQPVIPDVTGQTQSNATATITSIDSLTVGTVTYQYHDTVPADVVISQSPAPDTIVLTGSTVDLVVSLGPSIVPDVVGLNESQVDSAVTTVALVLGNISYEYSDTVPAQFVIRQSPAPGTIVLIGSTVNIVVSLGSPVVPDVVGLTEPNATAAIIAANMVTGTITYQLSATVPPGVVISQSLAPGTIVTVGTQIDLVVSVSVVPNVIGMMKQDARSVLGLEALIIGDCFYEYSDIIPAGIVVDQDPPISTQLPAGTGVDLWISLGWPMPTILEASQRLIELQNNDGGWDIPLDDGNPDTGTDLQTLAAIATGLARAYAITNDPNILTSLGNTRALLLSKTDNFVVTDGMLAVELDTILGGTICADHVRTNFFDKLADGTYYDLLSDTVYDTNGYIQTIREFRSIDGANNLAAWDLGIGLYDAQLVGADPNEWIDAVKAQIDEMRLDKLYDVIGLSGAVLGLASAGADYDPQAGMYASASSIQDLADELAINQLNTGGFTWHSGFFIDNFDEAIHETAYAVMALNEVDRVRYLSEIKDAGIYLQYAQLPTGGWKNFSLATEEENTITGEGLGAIVLAHGYVMIPDMVDYSQADANMIISAAGLVIDGIEYQYSDAIPDGNVLAQTPDSGILVTIGTSVDIVLSLGVPVAPNVLGMSESDANEAIVSSGLVVGTVTYDYNDTVPAWIVTGQNPQAGTNLAIGASVDLEVSLGLPITLPDVVGMTETTAASTLTGLGLDVGNVTYQYNVSIPAGQVITQTPTSGTDVPIGSSVDLVVSAVVVPDTTGMPEASAAQSLNIASLVVGNSYYLYSNTVPAGDVINQDPVAGTAVSIGSAVDLYVSLGQPPVPDLAGLNETDANSTLTGFGLFLGDSIYEYSDTVAVGLAISSIPPTGTIVPLGSVVDIIVSLGKPIAPNVVGLTLTEATAAITSVDSLSVGTITYQYSAVISADMVIFQLPFGGLEVPVGSSVDLTVSLGQSTIIPNVLNMSEAEAGSAIAAANLITGVITYEFSDTIAAGLVISQDPIAFTTTTTGSAVDLVISLGQSSIVPNVVGLIQSIAETTITVAGLTPNVILQHSNTITTGQVISQSPESGAIIASGSTVDIIVSLGPPVVPDVIGITETAADSSIANAGLVVGTITYEYNITAPAGIVLNQIPLGGTVVSSGSAVDLVVSLGQPIGVPNLVGLNKVDANSILTAAGLLLGQVSYQYHDTVAPGLVILQNPQAAEGVGLGTHVDINISLSLPDNIIASAGDRLVQLQNNDGGWDVPLDDADPNNGTDLELLAFVATGLAKAYDITSDSNMLSALQLSRTLLLSKTDTFAVTDGVLAARLDNILGGTACTDHLTTNFYDMLNVGTYYDLFTDATYDTAGFVQALRDARTGAVANLAAWDLGLGLYSAQLTGADTTQWIAATKAEIDELDDNASYDVLGLAGAILGLAAAGEDHDPQAGVHIDASDLADLVEILASYQISTGGFTWWSLFQEPNWDESIQETAYAILAMNEFDRAGFMIEIADAAIYLESTQLLTGGWENILGSGERNVITGDVIRAIDSALGQTIDVPDVTGLSEGNANTTITSAGLSIGEVIDEYSDTVTPGNVISQNPAVGVTVPADSFVHMSISLGPAVTVPYIVNIDQNDANTAIIAAGLVVNNITYEYSNTIPQNIVIRQNPSGLTIVPISSNVDFVVSSGMPIVPDVVGITLADANTAILSTGMFTVGTIDTEFDDVIPAGSVTNQDPTGGSTALIGSTIDIWISLGQGTFVPNLVGLNPVEVDTALSAADLVDGAITYQVSDTVPAGLIISQNPTIGTEVVVGSAVDMVVSLGPPETPDVVGMTQSGAAVAIQTAGLVVGVITYENSDTYSAGLVISQDPVPGTGMPTGSPVHIVVSLGRPITPDVVGMSQANAVAAINAVYSLAVGNITNEFSDTVPAGDVISQNPPAQTRVPIGSAIDIVVSYGMEVTVPNVFGLTQQNAETVITVAGLNPLVIFTVHETIPAGTVIAQNPLAGITIPEGASVTIVVSTGPPVVVPDVVDANRIIAGSVLNDANLALGNIGYTYSDTVAPGNIVSQDPVAGALVAVGTGIDVVVSLAQPEVAMMDGALRLVDLQNIPYGGWDYPLDDGDPVMGSDYATFASVAMGLVKTYKQTGDTNLEIPIQMVRIFLLGKIDNFEVGDGALAVEIDNVLGNDSCKDHLQTYFYDKLAAGTYYDSITGWTYDTAGYIQALRDRRISYLANLAAWDLGMALNSAHLMGQDTTLWLDALKAEIDQLDDDASSYDVLGLAGAIFGLASVGQDYDPQAGSYADASSLADLVDILAGFQLQSGGFTWRGQFMDPGDESLRETVYATLAMNQFNRPAYASAINDAAIYLQIIQLATGGWENDIGSGEINEITGEAMTALAIVAPFIGDFDIDGDTDLLDYSAFAAAWKSTPSDDNWNPICDLAQPPDQVIDELDLAVFVSNYLATE
jgi:beta-lactam-binding protein with PASTA domain